MDKVPSSNSSRKIGGLASTHVARPPHSRPASALASAHPHTWYATSNLCAILPHIKLIYQMSRANQLVVLAGDTDMLSVQVAYTEYCNWAAALGQPAFSESSPRFLRVVSYIQRRKIKLMNER